MFAAEFLIQYVKGHCNARNGALARQSKLNYPQILLTIYSESSDPIADPGSYTNISELFNPDSLPGAF
jgi:hypothetical protein